MILEYRKGHKIYTFTDKVKYREFIMGYIISGRADRLCYRGEIKNASYNQKKNIVFSHQLKKCNPGYVNNLWKELMLEIDFTDMVVVVKKDNLHNK